MRYRREFTHALWRRYKTAEAIAECVASDRPVQRLLIDRFLDYDEEERLRDEVIGQMDRIERTLNAHFGGKNSRPQKPLEPQSANVMIETRLPALGRMTDSEWIYVRSCSQIAKFVAIGLPVLRVYVDEFLQYKEVVKQEKEESARMYPESDVVPYAISD